MAASDNGNTVFLTAKVPASLKSDLEKLARQNFSSTSAELRRAVRDHLERNAA